MAFIQKSAFFALAISIVSLHASPPEVWVTDAMQRTKQNATKGSGTSITLHAAKGEYESFQIIVRAPIGGLHNVNASKTDLTSAGNTAISKSNIVLYREHYVPVTTGSANWYGTNRELGAGLYADALIPFTNPATGADLSGAQYDAVPFSMGTAGLNQPLWVDVFIPRTAGAGTYSATITITSTEGSVPITLTLKVWDFTLPLIPTCKSSFQIWNNDTGTNYNSKASQIELLRNRIMPMVVLPSDERELMDNWGYGATGQGFPFGNADISHCTMDPAPSVSSLMAIANSHQSGLYQYCYSADEIDNCPTIFPTVRAWARNIHAAGGRHLVTMTPAYELFDDESGANRSAVDIWVTLPVMYYGTGAIARTDSALKKGCSVWSYTCLQQDGYSPKWLIDFAPINYRIMQGFINQSMGFTGILYWKVNHWTSDPWNNVEAYGNYWPGDGMLVYPGAQAGVEGIVPSLRIKWIREGIEDYEYLQMLRQKGFRDSALVYSRCLGRDFKNWSKNTDSLYIVRKKMGDLLHVPVDAVPPKVTVTAPNSVVEWPIGSQKAIAWTCSDNVGIVSRSISYSTNGSSTWTRIDSAAGASGAQSYQWTVPNQKSINCFVRVIVYDIAGNSANDKSDVPFKIVDKPHFISRIIDTAQIGEPYGYKMLVQIGSGSIQLPILKKPGWLQSNGFDSLNGTPTADGSDTVRAVLKVDEVAYDTLTLRIIVISPPSEVVSFAAGKTVSRFGFDARITSGAMSIVVAVEKECDFTLSIFDVSGRKVWHYFESGASRGQYTVKPDIPEKNGVYIVRLKRPFQDIRKKVLLLR